MGKLRVLALVGALAAAAPLLPASPAAAQGGCTSAGPAIGGVSVSRSVGINITAVSGVWSCVGGDASVSLTVMPSNPIAALLVDNAVGSAGGTGSVVVNHTVPPKLLAVLLLPRGQCFTATQTVTGPSGGLVAIHTAKGCG
jgi:hypothetical protein